jgi:hypothetical protein
MSNWNFEQRITIHFYVKLGKGANEMCVMLSEGHGTEAMKKATDL